MMMLPYMSMYLYLNITVVSGKVHYPLQTRAVDAGYDYEMKPVTMENCRVAFELPQSADRVIFQDF